MACQVIARNGMYMIIDDHSEDTTITSSTTQWVSYWKQLMTDIASDTPSMMHVIADIFNEPDHAGFTWSTVCPCLAHITCMACCRADPPPAQISDCAQRQVHWASQHAGSAVSKASKHW